MKDYFKECEVAEEEKPASERNIKEFISKTTEFLFKSKNELVAIMSFLNGENFNTDTQADFNSMKEEVFCIYMEAKENYEIIHMISNILGVHSLGV